MSMTAGRHAHYISSLQGAGVLLLTVGAMILAVGVVAAIGPVRRSLRIPAMEALRTDT